MNEQPMTFSFWRKDIAKLRGNTIKASQHSVQWMVGILRHFQASFWLRDFSPLKQNPSPPHHH